MPSSRQPFVQQGREQHRCLVEGLAGDAPPVAAPGAIVLSLRPGGTVPRVIALPERSNAVDRLSAAHFAQVFEKDRHRFQPVAVAVDHGMFQAGVYLRGAMLLIVTAPLPSQFLYNRFAAEPSNGIGRDFAQGFGNLVSVFDSQN